MNEEENTKTLAAVLLRAPTIIRLDNIATGIDSSVLAEVLTTTEWECRILGVTQTVVFPNQVLWCATANNPTLSREVARRTVRIRINPKMECPETRKFANPKRLEWVMEHRAEILGHVFTIIRAWVVGGCRRLNIIHGGFNAWAGVIGGILDVARVPGLLENQSQLYEMADDETSIWRELVAAWWAKFGNRWARVKDLLELCQDQDLLGKVIQDKTPRSQQTRLGKALKGMRDRQFDGKTILAEIERASKRWQYRLAEENEEKPPVRPDAKQETIW